MSSIAQPSTWSPNVNVWLPLASQGAESSVRLFCFPHAGGGAASYRSWQNGMGPGIEVCALEYPGRWSRHREAPIADVHKLIRAIIDGVGDLFCGRFAFFGYSFGGLVGFELARTLRRLGRQQPDHLFVGAAQAPGRLSLREPIHGLPRAQFLDCIDRRYGLLPAAVRRDPDLLKLSIPVLHADITALETYVYTEEPPLSCAITAFGGTDDAAVSAEDLMAWRDVTGAQFASHRLPGGHFFIQTNEQRVHQQVRESLQARHTRTLS